MFACFSSCPKFSRSLVPFQKRDVPKKGKGSQHNAKHHTTQLNPHMGGQTKHPCPCCGYRTLKQKPPGSFALCAVCWWEDDSVQFNDPDYEGGANRPSLRQAQQNFATFGAAEQCFLSSVRKPTTDEQRDANWTPLSQQ